MYWVWQVSEQKGARVLCMAPLQMGQFSRSASAGSSCIGSLRFVMVLC